MEYTASMDNTANQLAQSQHLTAQGDQCFQNFKYEDALNFYMQAREFNKQNPDIYLRIGKAQMKLKNYREAEKALKVLYASSFVSIEADTLYAKMLLMQNKIKQAHEIIEKVMKLEMNDYEKYVALQVYLSIVSQKGDKEETVKIAEKLLKIQPKSYITLMTYVSYKNISELDDKFFEFYENEAKKIKGLDVQGEELFYALGQAFEKKKDYKKASKYAARGNAIHDYKFRDIDDVYTKFAEISKIFFNKGFFENFPIRGDTESTPIFIVGMPRSSTTLCEQILSSHSRVFGCGEMDTISKIKDASGTFIKSDKTYPLNLEDMSEKGANIFAESYFENLKRKGYEIDGKITTDKMPTNFYFLGLIATLFPNAKIINCVRDLRDVAMSIYMNKFDSGNHWAQSFEKIYNKMAVYKDLMKHWKEHLPIKIHDFNYADLLEDSEPEIRKLVDYCGLEWEDACLNFHKTDRVVQTASKAQVKKKLFKSSQGKWKNYEPYFGKELRKIGELND